MTIDQDKAREIRRLYFAEHWTIGTIAAQEGVHPDVVERVIGPLGPEPKDAPPRTSILDPFKPFIEETLKTYPKLTATRLYDMIVARNYSGSVKTVTRFVQKVRPQPKSEAFIRVPRLPGEQAQIDWGHVGKLAVPGGERALWVFVMVLAFSRAIFAELVFDLTVHSLLRSLLRASVYFGGVTRQWLFDNPKVVVLDRHGDLIRYHPGLLYLTSQLHVQPRLCGVRKPQEKGAVERVIRYLKTRFFPARTIHSIAHGNQMLSQFLKDVSMQRKHPEQDTQTVAEVLQEERPRLLALPENLPEVDLVTTVKADKTATVRFDKNRYSVPSEYHSSQLTLVASDTQVRFLNSQNECITEHERCWGRKQNIEKFEHRQAILDTKPGARDAKGRQRLLESVPQIEVLLEHWLHEGRNLGSMVARTLKLLELYGEDILRQAIDELHKKGSHDLGALAVLCDQIHKPMRARLPLELGEHVPDRDVPQHDLGDYDD